MRIDARKVMEAYQAALTLGLSDENAVGAAILAATQQMWSEEDLKAEGALVLCKFLDLWKELSYNPSST